MKIFGIENQIIKDMDIDVSMVKPNWNKIDNQLNNWKKRSISYLSDMLNNK